MPYVTCDNDASNFEHDSSASAELVEKAAAISGELEITNFGDFGFWKKKKRKKQKENKVKD